MKFTAANILKPGQQCYEEKEKREWKHNYIHFTLHLNTPVCRESASPLLTHQADEGYANRKALTPDSAFIIRPSICQSRTRRVAMFDIRHPPLTPPSGSLY